MTSADPPAPPQGSPAGSAGPVRTIIAEYSEERSPERSTDRAAYVVDLETTRHAQHAIPAQGEAWHNIGGTEGPGPMEVAVAVGVEEAARGGGGAAAIDAAVELLLERRRHEDLAVGPRVRVVPEPICGRHKRHKRNHV